MSRPRSKTRRVASATLVVLCVTAAPVLASGATTTRTRTVSKPPFRHGTLTEAANVVAAAPTGVGLPAGVPDSWQPRTELARLATEIDRWLRTAGPGAPSIAPLDTPLPGVAPTVDLGCELDAIDECDAELRRNVLVVTGGTREWRDAVDDALRSSGADHLLVLELRLRPHWIHQRGLAGRKEIRLGTDHVQPLPWLTSLDTPVWVVQLTGALVDRDGRVASAGAEGLIAVRTPFRASILDAQRMLRPDEVAGLLELRREELPGRPLVWEEAARRLVAGLASVERRR